MNAFLISAAKRYMDEIKVTTLPHILSPYPTEDFTLKGSEGPGLHAPTASSHSMKVLLQDSVAQISPSAPQGSHQK